MRILLIDNETTLLKRLQDLIPGTEITHKWSDLQGLNSNDFDLIVLSGGSKFQIVGNEAILKEEIEIIKRHETPLIGICYGCELIAQSFGCELEKMESSHRGIVEIKVTTKDDIFEGVSIFNASENHTWHISRLSNDLVSMAESIHGIEMVKHTSLPVYGFQFHPEALTDEKAGKQIFLNLLKQIEARSILAR